MQVRVYGSESEYSMNFIKTHRYFVIFILIIIPLSLYMFLNYINREQDELDIRDAINYFKKHDLKLIKTPLENKEDYILMKTIPDCFRFEDDMWGKVLIYKFNSIYDRLEASRLWAEGFDYESLESYTTHGAKNILIIYLLDDSSLRSSPEYKKKIKIMRQLVFDLNDCKEMEFRGKSNHWQYFGKQIYYKNAFETPDKDIKEEGNSHFTCELKYLGDNNIDVNNVIISSMKTTSYNIKNNNSYISTSGTYGHELEANQNGIYTLDLGLFGGITAIEKIELTLEWNGKSENILALPINY